MPLHCNYLFIQAIIYVPLFVGQKGMKGDNEKKSGGIVYVRWGHDQCPSTAQLVYSGRAGGPHYTQAGGGSNPQCLPLDPNFLALISGNQDARS